MFDNWKGLEFKVVFLELDVSKAQLSEALSNEKREHIGVRKNYEETKKSLQQVKLEEQKWKEKAIQFEKQVIEMERENKQKEEQFK